MESTSSPSVPRYLPFRGVENSALFYTALDAASEQIRNVDLHPGSYNEILVYSLRVPALKSGEAEMYLMRHCPIAEEISMI
jgi:hypothetical protein